MTIKTINYKDLIDKSLAVLMWIEVEGCGKPISTLPAIALRTTKRFLNCKHFPIVNNVYHAIRIMVDTRKSRDYVYGMTVQSAVYTSYMNGKYLTKLR